MAGSENLFAVPSHHNTADVVEGRLDLGKFLSPVNHLSRTIYIFGICLGVIIAINTAILLVLVSEYRLIDAKVTLLEPPVNPACINGGCVNQTNGCYIKGNVVSDGHRYYYLPTDPSYPSQVMDKASGDVWFCTETGAMQNGWTRAP